uniref:Uncharacterized protein n=1 Tax=Pediastrum angulosum TaxID=271408 RepID=A0A2U8GHG3_9CHLO|nr:hypothetical protein [Pediastrum angulosum]AWI68137.1 hypothetical protein [Pediastrum angulosum]
MPSHRLLQCFGFADCATEEASEKLRRFQKKHRSSVERFISSVALSSHLVLRLFWNQRFRTRMREFGIFYSKRSEEAEVLNRCAGFVNPQTRISSFALALLRTRVLAPLLESPIALSGSESKIVAPRRNSRCASKTSLIPKMPSHRFGASAILESPKFFASSFSESKIVVSQSKIENNLRLPKNSSATIFDSKKNPRAQPNRRSERRKAFLILRRLAPLLQHS